MRILLITQYFWPEEFRINELASRLAERGHQITVLTGLPNYPSGKFFAGYGFGRRTSEKYKGVDVVRVPLAPRGKGGGMRLSLNYASFAVMASLLGPIRCRCTCDAIFVYEPSPITVGIPAIVMKAWISAPVMFWVQDLWPESLSATGMVRSAFILNAVKKLVKFIYAHCDCILVQSKSFIDAIASTGVDRSKIKYFPNSAEGIFDTVTDCGASLDPSYFPDGFRVMFAGNIGAAQDFETILKAAELLKEHQSIHWIIVGDGRKFPWVSEQVQIRSLCKTVHLLGRHPLESMPAFYSRADVMLVTLKKDPIFALTIPGKVQSYLACSRPIIAALDGEGARVVEEAGAGWTGPAEDYAVLAKNVLKAYHTSADDRGQMALRGRHYFEKNFESSTLLDRLEGWLYELAGRISQ
ncbi:MAG TPA: glycosyltransferase family 4 protein [Smithellaceae bacterium]|nr:glycosyltransferase family 4 protein [Smithellaceae bacterium]HOG81964.1 glycosyltransferase family 4 protein [Smithellaceae bacterium]